MGSTTRDNITTLPSSLFTGFHILASCVYRELWLFATRRTLKPVVLTILNHILFGQ